MRAQTREQILDLITDSGIGIWGDSIIVLDPSDDPESALIRLVQRVADSCAAICDRQATVYSETVYPVQPSPSGASLCCSSMIRGKFEALGKQL